MYDYLTGKIAVIGDNYVTLDNNGIGYMLYASAQSIASLSMEDAEVQLYVYMAVREDDISLYGFATELERKVFLKLITVPKIGAKVALNILSIFTASEVISHVKNKDSKTLALANGIGKKTSEQIVVNLQDKFDDIEIENSALGASQQVMNVDLKEEAIEALMSLGFDRNYSNRLVSSIDSKDELTLEEIVAIALGNVNN